MAKLIVCVVIFQIKPSSSETVKSLITQNFNNFHLIIHDNSDCQTSDDQRKYLALNFRNHTYRHTGCNNGLAFIYNDVLKSSVKNYDLLITFDQDTRFDNDYLDKVADCYVRCNKFFLYVPIVESQSQYHSPKPDVPLVRKFWKAKGNTEYHPKFRLNSINSGNAINIKLASNLSFKFDENLLFYGVDNYLFRYLYKNNMPLYVIDSTIIQSLSVFETPDHGALLTKYKSIMVAYKYVYFNNGFNIWKIFAILHILKLSLYKLDVRFLKLFECI